MTMMGCFAACGMRQLRGGPDGWKEGQNGAARHAPRFPTSPGASEELPHDTPLSAAAVLRRGWPCTLEITGSP